MDVAEWADSRFSSYWRPLACRQANCRVIQIITVTLESFSHHELHDRCRFFLMRPHRLLSDLRMICLPLVGDSSSKYYAPHAVASTDGEEEEGRGACAKPSTAAPGRQGNHEQELFL